MKQQARGLLGEIEQGVLTEDVPTTTLLRKCIVLGGRAGSSELRDWARRELHGYDSDDELPEYRKIYAGIYLDAIAGNTQITGQAISSNHLPSAVREAEIDEQLRLRISIAELEDLVHRGEPTVKLSLPQAPLITQMMNSEHGDPFQQIHAVYWKVSVSTVHGIVEKIRTALAELVGELIDSVEDPSASPSKEAADQAVNLIISGQRNTVNVNTAQSASGGNSIARHDETGKTSTDAEPWWQRWRKRGLIIGFSTVVAAVAGVATWLEWTPWN